MSEADDSERAQDPCGAIAPGLSPATTCLMPKGHRGPHQAGDDGEVWFLHDARGAEDDDDD